MQLYLVRNMTRNINANKVALETAPKKKANATVSEFCTGRPRIMCVTDSAKAN